MMPTLPPEPPELTPPENDEEGHWISPGAAKRIRSLIRVMTVFVIVLGINAVLALDGRRVAYDARDSSVAETRDRIEANTRNAKINCEAVNAVAAEVKKIIDDNSNGGTITQADVDRIVDPELRALVQAIVNRSTAKRDELQTQGEAIPVLDCAAQARRAAR